MSNQRNLLLAVALSFLLIIGWDFAMQRIYPQPETPEGTEQAAPDSEASPKAAATDAGPEVRRSGGTNIDAASDEAAAGPSNEEAAPTVAAPDPVAIDAPELAGSINPMGARIDDVVLKPHREELAKDSDPVRIFAKSGTEEQHFAQFGFVGDGVKTPTPDTVWQTSGGPLAPENPVTLSWDNGEGQRFTVELTVDEHYMISAKQTVANTGQGSIAIQPFASINRTSKGVDDSNWIIHSGPIGAFDQAVDFSWNFDDVAEAESGRVTPAGNANWIGFTDKYWLSALIPDTGTKAQADFRSLGNDIFRADVIYETVTVPAGKQVSRSTQLFAGAKESELLAEYQANGIPQFGNAIDWGWFGFIEKPMLWILKQLFAFFGNFGVAIMLLTLLVRIVLFPIAQKQFKSFAGMRAVQPKVKALQDRYKDDKPKLQQEMMALYKKEGVNPLAGCLPTLLQIPIFFALYKVLMLSIEMRHQPFALWIKDLSAPDPATILNLFGLLPFEVPSFLGVGVLAVLLGASMWLQFKLNPAPTDPIQQQVFAIMPWLLMLVMAPFAAGLLLYWITNNVLTLAQQKFLYSRDPALKAQAEKDKADREREKAREAKG